MFYHLILGEFPPPILLWWGYWDPYIDRIVEILDTKVLMDDQCGRKMWAIEKHIRRTLCYYGIEWCINSTYIHIHYKRVSETGIPFDSLTCNFCKLIHNYDEFRKSLYHESRTNIKIHGRDTRKGRMLDHLTQVELKIVARDANSTHRLTMRSLWWERTKVTTMSIRTRSLRENLFESVGRKDVCEPHKQGKLQGKDVIWEFVQDIIHSLVRLNSGRRYSAST